ncbi:hypothetical protein SDC9_181599 [bioreactor metagenome]|uniref:Uncharacterized protein n=1 Tax=bioreactor metagenome TaxID=1076179 RepID=A0A645H6H9_9ZZZZ
MGDRTAVRPGLRLLCLVRRAAQLRFGRGLPSGRGRIPPLVAGQLSPDRQGHPDYPHRLLADHAQGDESAAAGNGFRPRLVADRQDQDEQIPRQCDQSDGDDRPLRRRRLPLLPAGGDVAGDGRELYRGDLRRALQHRSGQRPRQSHQPGAEDGAAQLRRRDSLSPRPGRGGRGAAGHGRPRARRHGDGLP